MKLESWYTHYQGSLPDQSNAFQSPEQQTVCIGVSGFVYDKPGFNDGDHVNVSQPQDVYEEGDKVFMRTFSGSIYELGEPLKDYEDRIPKAKQRLVDTFKRMKETQPC